MTKSELFEAFQNLPDNAEIIVIIGNSQREIECAFAFGAVDSEEKYPAFGTIGLVGVGP